MHSDGLDRVNRYRRWKSALVADVWTPRRKRQDGFILSIEAILVITILGIGLFVGISAVRNALAVRNAYRDHTRFLVVADNGLLIGEAVGFDEYDTPLVPFVDYHPSGKNYRTLIGVRPDRFTSRQAVFYEDEDCQPSAAVCLAQPDSTLAASIFLALDMSSAVSYRVLPGESYLSAMQGEDGAPLYGVGGAPTGASGGLLFRTTGAPCGADELRAVWYSRAPGSDRGGLCLALPESTAPDLTFLAAEPVSVPGNSGLNVLEKLEPPFRVNLVVDPAEIQLTPPCPEGASCPSN